MIATTWISLYLLTTPVDCTDPDAHDWYSFLVTVIPRRRHFLMPFSSRHASKSEREVDRQVTRTVKATINNTYYCFIFYVNSSYHFFYASYSFR